MRFLRKFRRADTGLARRMALWAALGFVLSWGAPLGLWVYIELVRPAADVQLLHVYGYTATSTALVFVGLALVIARVVHALAKSGFRDALTGLYNRRYLNESMRRIAHECAREGQPLSVLMLDLDRFKRVNDEFGHDVGDRVLTVVAHALRASVRQVDIPMPHRRASGVTHIEIGHARVVSSV